MNIENAKKYKIQNRSQQKSLACVPLNTFFVAFSDFDEMLLVYSRNMIKQFWRYRRKLMATQEQNYTFDSARHL